MIKSKFMKLEELTSTSSKNDVTDLAAKIPFLSTGEKQDEFVKLMAMVFNEASQKLKEGDLSIE